MATIEQTDTETQATPTPAVPAGGAARHVPHGPDDHVGHGAVGLTNVKLGMWLFLASDCLFFGAFISTYLLYRGRPQEGPTPRELFNIPFTSATSFILLMSSLAMVLALAAIQRGDHRRFRLWLLATALFGATFIAGQVFEFTEFYREGLHLDTNLFGSSFYVLTGFHGAHVTIGIIWLLSLWGLSMQGRINPERSEAVEVAGLYWHFVDVVWIVIFTVIYLMPQPGR
jgi:heme/copper-type cytochrome/quinol oxidase subunit 3